MTQTRPNRSYGHLKARGTAFVAGFAIMTVELLAARIIAPYLGSSLYTWTAVIMAVMAGVGIGAWTGGRLADGKAAKLGLPASLALSSIFVFLIPAVSDLVGATFSGASISIQIRALIFSCIVFLPSSAVLGSLTPQLVKMDLKRLQESGSTYGNISAWNAAGSIAGTYATGFLFIGYLHTKSALYVMAGILFFLACFAFFLETRKSSSL